MPQPEEGPKKIKPKGLADYLDVLTRAVFQSGISWRVVEAKWPGTTEAFGGFDPEHIADLSPAAVDALAGDTRLIRNRAKIEATVQNAETMLALDREHGSFRKYLRSFPTYDALQTDLVKRFKFLGNLGAYWFLYVVGEQTPPHEEWMATYQPEGLGAKPRSRRPKA
jgi:3-methyladenine DNA glycosylase Tag